jgi:RNA polymerase sporulation-specific sigma factor
MTITDKFLIARAKSGDQVAREQLVHRHIPLVSSRTAKYAVRASAGYAREDILQDAFSGLLKAIERYEDSHGAAFTTYATHCIDSTIRDGLRARRDTIRVSQADRMVIARMQRARDEWSGPSGPTVEQLAANVGVPEEKAIELEPLIDGVLSIDFDYGDNERSFHDVVCDPQVDVAAEAELAIEHESAVEAIANLKKENERRVIECRYVGDMTVAETASELNLSTTRVSQLETRALGKMRRNLGLTGQVERIDDYRTQVAQAKRDRLPANDPQDLERTNERPRAAAVSARQSVNPEIRLKTLDQHARDVALELGGDRKDTMEWSEIEQKIFKPARERRDREFEEAVGQLRAHFGREPNFDEIAKATGLPLDDALYLRARQAFRDTFIEITDELGRRPSFAEIREYTGMPLDEISSMVNSFDGSLAQVTPASTQRSRMW